MPGKCQMRSRTGLLDAALPKFLPSFGSTACHRKYRL
jgi:hypothetical protein